MVTELVVRARKLSQEVPWQRIADSPTTKYYTNWQLFERYLNAEEPKSFARPEGKWSLVVGPCGDGYNYDIDETILDISESRLYAEHVARLGGAYQVSAEGELSIALCRPEGTGWYSHHLTIVVDPGKRASLLVYAPMGSSGTVGIELRAKKDSKVDMLVVTEPDETYPTAFILRTAVGVRATVNSATLSTASVMNRVDEGFVTASSSYLSHSSFSVARGRQRLDNVIDAVQTSHDSLAFLRGRAAAFDSSFVSVRGTVTMMPQASRSSSNFQVEALLLGDRASAYTMPMMRIDTGDVAQATHRAAQYRLPLDELFYLQSRGLDVSEAQELILWGLGTSSVEHLGEGLREKSVEYLVSMLRPRSLVNPQSQEAPAPS